MESRKQQEELRLPHQLQFLPVEVLVPLRQHSRQRCDSCESAGCWKRVSENVDGDGNIAMETRCDEVYGNLKRHLLSAAVKD